MCIWVQVCMQSWLCVTMVIVVQSSPKHHCVQYLYNAFTEHAVGLCRVCLLLRMYYVSVCLCVIHTVFPTIYSIILYTKYSLNISTSPSPHHRPTSSGETPPNTQQRWGPVYVHMCVCLCVVGVHVCVCLRVCVCVMFGVKFNLCECRWTVVHMYVLWRVRMSSHTVENGVWPSHQSSVTPSVWLVARFAKCDGHTKIAIYAIAQPSAAIYQRCENAYPR